MGFTRFGLLIIVNLLLLAAGNFMEPSAIVLIMAPIIFLSRLIGMDLFAWVSSWW